MTLPMAEKGPPQPLANPPVQVGWQLVLQYGSSSYVPTADASGTVDEHNAGFAKLSDAAINSMDDDSNTYDYYMMTSDPQNGDSADNGKLFVRTFQSTFNDLGRNMGWETDYFLCSSQNASSLSECGNWIAPSDNNGRFDTELVHGIVATYDPLRYDCKRWWMDHSSNPGCWNGPTGSTVARCLTGNLNCGIENFGIRTNFKLYKLVSQATTVTTVTNICREGRPPSLTGRGWGEMGKQGGPLSRRRCPLLATPPPGAARR